MKFVKPFNSSIYLFLIVVAGVLSGCNYDARLFKKAKQNFELGEYEWTIREVKPLAQRNYRAKETNYFVAESYRLSNRIQYATPFYLIAKEKGYDDKNINLHLAYAAKANGKYADARKYLKEFIDSKPSRELVVKAEIELENLPAVEEYSKKPSPVKIQGLVGNTNQAEFGPIKIGDELILTSSKKPLIYKNNGLPFLGLYKARLKSPGEIEKLELFSANLLDANANEGTPAFSKDGNTMVFARGNSGKSKDPSPDVDLYISTKRDGNWSTPERLAISDSIGWDGSPAFSRDGKTLYFSSNRRGGKGGLDLYRAPMDNSGRFGRPINLGSTINTRGNELFPYVSEDGKLYFSSDGHPSLGGLDLFVASRSGDEIQIEHLGVPINSVGDDFGLFLADSTQGYFSSNRVGGKGDDDIYYFESTGSEDRWWSNEIMISESGEAAKVALYHLRTQIVNERNKPIAKAKVGIKRNGEIQPVQFSNAEGYLDIIDLNPADQISFNASKEKYLTKRSEFLMDGREIPKQLLKKELTDTTFDHKITLGLAEVGEELGALFDVNPIYYDLDKSNIRPDAAAELDKIVQVLKDNPGVSIELGSHTDARASASYNLKLSQRRADSAVKYIIEHGIEASRIKAKGYGETQLINGCSDGVDCSEEAHQENRRTEFKITDLND
ncbi:OmpA family protein [Aquirufa sp. KTFRIE-69F]|uniref:OmpA family protein n=1 Tax=Aquirufa originis TaxID=3096514 RepID=A0ABW6DAI8_9BACT